MSEELQQLVPIEEQISQELVKHNYTEAKLRDFEEYLNLDIVGDDKEAYLIIKDKRKEVKSYRVAVEKFCKFKREDAVKIQKAWVAQENELVARMSKVEDHLEAKEKAYEKKIAEEKEARKRKQEEQLIMRQQVLSAMGVLYSEGAYTLGDISFELSIIKETEQDIWEESILPLYKEEYEKVEAERIEHDRIKLERESELKRQQEELEHRQQELAQKEAALKLAQEEQDRKQKSEADKKLAEAKAAREAKEKLRCDQLTAIGLMVGMEDGHLYFKGYDSWVSHIDITVYDDDKWDEMIGGLTAHVAKKKEDEEQRRLSEIEIQKEVDRKKSLGDSRFQSLKSFNYTRVPSEELAIYPEEDWLRLHADVKKQYDDDLRLVLEKEQADKRAQDEVIRLQKLDAAKDKEKWEEMMQKVNEVVVYEMRSSQYRKKTMILREKLEEIKAL